VTSKRSPWLLMAPLLLVPAGGLAWWSLRESSESAPRMTHEDLPALAPRSAPSENPEPTPSTETVAPSVLAQVSEKMERERSLRKTNPKERRRLLREVVALDPTYVPALEELSLALFHDENHDEARELSAKCLAVASDNETCRMVRDYALIRGPEADQVGETARECLAETPDDAKCLATTIGYDVLQKKFGEAKELTDKLEKLDPDAKQTYLAKARLESVAGNYEEARRDLDEACRQGMEQACFRADALRGEGW